MTTYLVTGATGFIGSRLVAELLRRPDCAVVHVLVRGSSQAKLDTLMTRWPNAQKVVPVVGDLGQPHLGVDPDEVGHTLNHVVHMAALYDVTATDEANERTNIAGTRNALEFAALCGAPMFHHVSSIAVAGDHAGVFTETDFEVGQRFPSPYHRTKFESERVVRDQDTVPYTVYRPSVVVGDSRNGEIDKVDGPYYMLPTIARLAALPRRLPLPGPHLGYMNVVPVDYVVKSMCALMHSGAPSGTVHHLSSAASQSVTEVFNAFAGAAGAPRLRFTVPFSPTRAFAASRGGSGQRSLRQLILADSIAELGLPIEAIALSDMPVRFDNARTRRLLGDLGLPQEPPPLAEYADVLYDYWARHLDPDRARRVDPRDPLLGRKVVITGASSGVGRALALACARRGATVILLARRADELDAVRAEIESAGGLASCHPCDITDEAAISVVVKQILEEHGAVDFLVNNAGRSIRRSVLLSTERMHDFERTMSVNYFAAVRLTLAFLPSMIERQFGHIVNVTSQAVAGHPPRYAAYTASKAALEEFGLVAGRELLAEGITFSNVRLPLVKTPMSEPSAPVNRHLPKISPEAAAERIIIEKAMIRRHETATQPGGRLAEISGIAAPRMARTATNLFAFQAMGETAPDARRLNTRPPAVSFAATIVRLAWRSAAKTPVGSVARRHGRSRG